ncbi:MAG: META domain-containing protein [Phycisphaerales bacterium]|jgi:heat shock protein HslJ|nr:META domain-containing protein [Phycisphaerales bacterium]
MHAMHHARRRTTLAAIVAALPLISACASSDDAREPSDEIMPPSIAFASLVANEWSVASVDGAPPPSGCVPTLVFSDLVPSSGKDVFVGRAGGLAGVNRASAEVTVGPDDAIRFGPIIATRMAGPEPHMRFERAYLDALQGATAYTVSIDGMTLTITGGAKVVLSSTGESPR